MRGYDDDDDDDDDDASLQWVLRLKTLPAVVSYPKNLGIIRTPHQTAAVS